MMDWGGGECENKKPLGQGSYISSGICGGGGGRRGVQMCSIGFLLSLKVIAPAPRPPHIQTHTADNIKYSTKKKKKKKKSCKNKKINLLPFHCALSIIMSYSSHQ